MAHYKRRNYLIDKESQGRFMAIFALASMTSGAVSVITFIVLARGRIDELLYSMWIPDTQMGNLLVREMALALGVGALAVSLLFAVSAAKLFAGITGPLQKMKATVRHISEGDLTVAVKLREKDYFQPFAVELAGLVDNWHGKFSALDRGARQLAELDTVRRTLSDQTTNEKYRQIIADLKKTIASYTT